MLHNWGPGEANVEPLPPDAWGKTLVVVSRNFKHFVFRPAEPGGARTGPEEAWGKTLVAVSNSFKLVCFHSWSWATPEWGPVSSGQNARRNEPQLQKPCFSPGGTGRNRHGTGGSLRHTPNASHGTGRNRERNRRNSEEAWCEMADSASPAFF